MKRILAVFLIACPLFAQVPEIAETEAVPLDATRLIDTSTLGWYQLEGEWSFEEVDGILVGYASGEGNHFLVLADADGEPRQRFLVPAGFAVRERGDRLMVMDRLTAIGAGDLQTFVFANTDEATMTGCWNPLAAGHYDCSGAGGPTCTYQYTDADGNCIRLHARCGSGKFVRVDPTSGELETNIEPSRCDDDDAEPIDINPQERL